MAGPITWRSIGNGGGGGNVASLLHMGQGQIQQGMETLAGIMKDNQKREQQNFLAARDNNTQKYMDAVAAAGGVDALQDPATRANLEAMRAGFGAAIDREGTRNALDDRITGLQKAAYTANQYQDQATERDQRALVDQGMALAGAGDMAGVQKLLADNQFFNEGQLTNQLMGVIDGGTNRAYRAEDQARQGRQEQRSIAQFNMSQELSRANLTDRNEQRELVRNSNLLKAAVLQVEDREKQVKLSNPLASVATDPIKAANESVNKVRDKISPWTWGDADSLDSLTNRITGYIGDGFNIKGRGKVKIPQALVDQYLQRASQDSFRSESTLLADMDSWIKNFATNNPGAFDSALKASEELKNINQLKRGLQDQQIGVLQGNKMDTDSLSDILDKLRTDRTDR